MRLHLPLAALVAVGLATFAGSATSRAQSGSPALTDPIARNCFSLAINGYRGGGRDFSAPAELAMANLHLADLAAAVSACRDARALFPADRIVIAAEYRVTEMLFMTLLGLKRLPMTDVEGVAAVRSFQDGGDGKNKLFAPLVAAYLGTAYEHGFGVPTDRGAAEKIFAQAAAAGDAAAAAALAKLKRK